MFWQVDDLVAGAGVESAVRTDCHDGSTTHLAFEVVLRRHFYLAIAVCGCPSPRTLAGAWVKSFGKGLEEEA